MKVGEFSIFIICVDTWLGIQENPKEVLPQLHISWARFAAKHIEKGMRDKFYALDSCLQDQSTRVNTCVPRFKASEVK
ncbi:MAG: hypothetical protein MHMPM18_004032, partial [Marteilia pararefringens]